MSATAEKATGGKTLGNFSAVRFQGGELLPHDAHFWG